MANPNDIFPPKDALPGSSLNWGRAVETRIRGIERDLVTLGQDVSGHGRTLASALEDISRQLNQVVDASRVYYADSGAVAQSVSPGSWFSSPPSVVASSMTGRFRVSVSASANDGIAFAGFEAPSLPRSRMVGGSPEASMARVSILGAASALGTASRDWIINLPPNTPHTFTCHVLGAGNGSLASYVQGLSITVQPLL